MRYLSVCSGIEAASVAWHHLGWEPVGFSEIEPFPAAVLKHRFPHVPNYGDMTKFEEWPIEPGTVDLLVGGTPCQSYSVAGLRQGLADPRGSLMLTYLAIAARLQPRWIVWENVPGVLSSNGGRDFGTFLGALGQLWYGVAYRVLDAQYVRVGRWPRAVPQRRRRVFVVGYLGDGAAAAEVLALKEGLRRHLEAQSKKGKSSSPDAEGGARGGCWWDGGQVSQTLDAVLSKGQTMPEKNRFPAVLQPTAYRWQNDALGLQQDDAVAALRASAGSSGFHEMNHPVIAQPVPIQDGREIEKRQNGLGIGQPGDPAYTVDTTAAQAVAFTVDMQACKGNANVGDGSVSPTLCKPSGNDVHAVAIGTDCYNGAITGDVAATMGTPGSSVNASGPTVMQAMAFDWQSGGDSRGLDPKETAQLQRCQTPAVAHSLRADGFDASEDGTGRGTPLVPQAMTVRRLSPRECERLQGFPDNWTLIPWRKKPAEECPDGPRYKALGNSMACNCMAWIGEKIAKWEADHA